MQTHNVEKLVKQQFCRRASEVALGHCFTMSENYSNATKPPHVILTQFTKRVTHSRHGRHFFSGLLGANESSAGGGGHDTRTEYRIE